MRRLRGLWNRFAHDTAFRRTTLLVTAAAILLVGEIVLLSVDLPRHQDLLVHTGATVAVILLPVTILGIACRLPAGRRRVARRFIIRPFMSVSAKSAFDGAAIASLLYRALVELTSTSPTARAKGRFEGRGGSSIGTFSVVGTSLHLDWLWTQLRTLVTGQRDVVIDGLVADATQGSIELKVWTSNNAATWAQVLGNGPFQEALETAINRLTRQILRALDARQLAQIYATGWNDDEAMSLLLAEESLESQLELAAIAVGAEYLTRAQRLVDEIARWPRLNDSQYITLQQIKAEIKIRRGNCDAGRQILSDTLAERSQHVEGYGLRTLLADSFAYQRHFASAIEQYTLTENEAAGVLGRDSAEQSLDNIDRALARGVYAREKDLFVEALLAIHNTARSRAQCRRLLSPEADDSLSDLMLSHKAIDKLREIDVWHSIMYTDEAATAAADISYYYFEKDAGEFAEWNRAAVDLFDEAISRHEHTLNITDDDVQTAVALAWASYAKAACLLQRLRRSASEPSHPLDAEVEQFMRILDTFPGPAKKPVLVHFRHARDLAANRRNAEDQLQRTACSVLEGVVGLDSDAVMDIRSDLVALDASRSSTAGPDTDRASGLKLSPSAETAAEQAGLDAGDRLQLYSLICRLLDRLIHHEDPEQLNDSFGSMSLRIDAEIALNRSYELFALLGRPGGSKRLKAESAYGYACLSAIGDNGAGAARHLLAAQRMAGENTRAYLNRALLDKDFNAVREHPEFAALWGEVATAAEV